MVQGSYVGDGYAAQVTALGGNRYHIVGWKNTPEGSMRRGEKVAEGDGVPSGGRIVFGGRDWSAEIHPESGLLVGRYQNGDTYRLRRIDR